MTGSGTVQQQAQNSRSALPGVRIEFRGRGRSDGPADPVQRLAGLLVGAAVQGLGYATSEEFVVKDGIPQTTHLKDLGLKRFKELPEIVAIPVEDYHPKGPFGAKGMGELAITPTAPAVGNAVHDALGVWVNSLPMTPEKVLAALKK